MKTYREELTFEFPERVHFKNITMHVQLALENSGVQEGLLLVSSYHTTAGIFINDEEKGLLGDVEEYLAALVPYEREGGWKHNSYEDNADSHIKRLMIGRSETLGISYGKLELGNWEQIFCVDFDGKRKKKFLIKIIGE